MSTHFYQFQACSSQKAYEICQKCTKTSGSLNLISRLTLIDTLLETSWSSPIRMRKHSRRTSHDRRDGIVVVILVVAFVAAVAAADVVVFKLSLVLLVGFICFLLKCLEVLLSYFNAILIHWIKSINICKRTMNKVQRSLNTAQIFKHHYELGSFLCWHLSHLSSCYYAMPPFSSSLLSFLTINDCTSLISSSCKLKKLVIWDTVVHKGWKLLVN